MGQFRVLVLRLSKASPADMNAVQKQLELRYVGVLWRFTISFGQLETFENDERTRSFVSLLVDEGCKQVSIAYTLALAAVPYHTKKATAVSSRGLQQDRQRSPTFIT